MHGNNHIGYTLSHCSEETFKTVDPINNNYLEGEFHIADKQEIEQAVSLANKAFLSYRNISPLKRANFLEQIGDEMLALGDRLVQRASLETALTPERIENERVRTIKQLKLYADLIKEGSWINASIDPGDPYRKPGPKPDLRRMYLPIGTVVVFTASNFPLAYSTAGGDTASALAAGNPVIVKSHPSHAGTNELVADAIVKAAKKTGMPDGVFSSLNDNTYTVGERLVKHFQVQAVAFTGSYNGGMALYKMARDRKDPIPVFAEMGSTNPVYILEDSMKENFRQIASTMAGSITLGSGQFCTNPGLMVGVESDAQKQFLDRLTDHFRAVEPSVMLSNNIANNYYSNLEKTLRQKGVELLFKSSKGDAFEIKGIPVVATVSFNVFKDNPLLHEEVFGPFSLFVACKNKEELLDFADLQQGQLTTSVFGTVDDLKNYTGLIGIIQDKAGRLIFNGVPTGVEVTTSIQHGGPFPATTDSRFTSVGPDAILRFVRPVAYQNAPQSILPDELKDGNPRDIWRKLNGVPGKD